MSPIFEPTRRLLLAAPAVLAAGLPGRPRAAAIERRDRIEQHGVTFHFAAPRPAGRYVSGDWFVLGPVEITAITPASASVTDKPWLYWPKRRSRVIHGAQIGWHRRRHHPQGLDDVLWADARFGRFDPAANLDPGFTGKPLRIAEPATLIKGVSRPARDLNRNLRPCVSDIVFLTVVERIPPEGAFRPSAEPGDKTAPFLTRDLDRAILPELALPPGIRKPVGPFRFLKLAERPHWNQSGRYDMTRQFMALNNQRSYGREHAYDTAWAVLSLCNRGTPLRGRRRLFDALVQQGLDLAAMVGAGAWIKASDGNSIGRALPMVLTAAATKDPEIARLAGAPHGGTSEAGQFFHVDDTVIGKPRFTPDRPRAPYTEDMRGIPEFGGQHLGLGRAPLQPERSGAQLEMDYRDIVSNAMLPTGLAMHLIRGGVEAFDHPAFFDYLDRWMDSTRHGVAGRDKGPSYSNSLGASTVFHWRAWRDESPRPRHRARPEIMADYKLMRPLGLAISRGVLFRAEPGGAVIVPRPNPKRDRALDADTTYELRYSLDGQSWASRAGLPARPFRIGGLERETRYFMQMRAVHPEHGAGPWSVDWFWWSAKNGYEIHRPGTKIEALPNGAALLRRLEDMGRDARRGWRLRRTRGKKRSKWLGTNWLGKGADLFVPEKLTPGIPHIPFVITL